MCTTQVEDLDLKPIISPDEAPVVVHGTYKKAWESIRQQVRLDKLHMVYYNYRLRDFQ